LTRIKDGTLIYADPFLLGRDADLRVHETRMLADYGLQFTGTRIFTDQLSKFDPVAANWRPVNIR